MTNVEDSQIKVFHKHRRENIERQVQILMDFLKAGGNELDDDSEKSRDKTREVIAMINGFDNWECLDGHMRTMEQIFGSGDKS